MEDLETKKLYAVAMLVQAIYAGVYLLSKAVLDGGMNNLVFVFYRQATAAAVLAPLAFDFERKTAPPLSFPTFCKIFLISLFGRREYDSNFGGCGAQLSACHDLLLGSFIQDGNVETEDNLGMGKAWGVIVCLGGAATLAFYKGPHIKLWCHRFGHHNINNRQSYASSGMIWVKGCFLILSSNFCWAFWLVMQAWIIKSYPSKLMLTTLVCFISSIQSLVIAIPLVRDTSQWKLGWNIRLLAVAYSGIVVTGLTYYLQAWVIEKRGPVFLAMFTPLALIITILFSSFLLCEILTFGSILGGVLLIGGLYSVLWGKTREGRLDQGSCEPPKVDQECSQVKQEEAGPVPSPNKRDQ